MNKQKILKAINWNSPDNKFYDDLYRKQAEQFWLPEEIPVSEDKDVWNELDEATKVVYKRILAGLTLLDTKQTSGINKVGEMSNNEFVQSILALFGGFESIHARSYSTIFQTLCSTDEINELFDWVEKTKELQSKVHSIIKHYDTKNNLFMAYVASLCLEGICFYSGFYLPLLLAGQGKMVHSGEIINLILRDEKLHTVGVGFFAMEELNRVQDNVTKELYIEKAIQMIEQVYNAELEYTKVLYEGLDCFEDVKTYIQYNVNYALSCIKQEPMFDTKEEDVNPIVMNGYSIETKNHDFFSTKGQGYIKSTNVEPLKDEDFIF